MPVGERVERSPVLLGGKGRFPPVPPEMSRPGGGDRSPFAKPCAPPVIPVTAACARRVTFCAAGWSRTNFLYFPPSYYIIILYFLRRRRD